MSKKGRTLMVFATVSGDPSEKETEEITGLWQGSLFNANFDVQRLKTIRNKLVVMHEQSLIKLQCFLPVCADKRFEALEQ